MSSLFDPNRNQEASGMGLIANIDGSPSRRIITQSIAALGRITHVAGQMPNHTTSDGCGLLISMPQDFFFKQWPLLLHGPKKSWAVGQLFLPRNANLRSQILNIIRQNLDLCDLHFLDGREVPISPHILHKSARAALPFIAQILVCPKHNNALPLSGEVFERRLFLARRIIEHNVNAFLHTHGHDTRQFHVVSFSANSIVYKALVQGSKLLEFYNDLQHDAFLASYTIFHKRFSNNRVSSWRCAQPMRMLAHSGEIHSLNGLLNYLHMCTPILQSSHFGADLKKILPIMNSTYSPAATLDNICEFLYKCGRTLPQILMMLFPEHMSKDSLLSTEQQAFYKFSAALLPPLSGSSCVIFTDGARFVGAMQDAKSKQACRYSLSNDGLFILGTEHGALDIPTKNIMHKSRLRPGELIALDLLTHRICYNNEIKGNIIHEQHYKHLVSSYLTPIGSMDMGHMDGVQASSEALKNHQELFTTKENISPTISPLPIFNEGTFFDYFNLITTPLMPSNAQVQLESFVGRAQNFLEPHAKFCKTLCLDIPFMHPKQLEALLKSKQAHICIHTLDASFNNLDLATALESINYQAELALQKGATILLLSSKSMQDSNRATASTLHRPIPSLLAVASLHKHLLTKHLRHLCGIIIDSHDAYKALHMTMLINAGADAITINLSHSSNDDKNYINYIQHIQHEFKKILKLLGLNSLLSLKDGQYFEAVGLSSKIVNKYFNAVLSRIGGLDLEQIAKEVQNTSLKTQNTTNEPHDDYNNELKNLLQLALTRNSIRIFRSYLKHCHHKENPHSLRCLLKLKEYSHTPSTNEPIEPSSDIVKRFAITSMPNLSRKAWQCLTQAYHDVGCSSPKSYNQKYFSPSYELHLKNLNLSQITNCEEIQISLGNYITTSHNFFTLHHHDLTSLNDIEQLVYDLRKAHPHARITIKVPSHSGIGNLGIGMVKAGVHCILVYGCADIPISSPLFPMSYEALPWEMGLAELQHALTANNLRRQVRLRVLGQFFTGQDIIKAALLGAEEFVFPTPLMLSLGCNLCKQCQSSPCPMGLYHKENSELSFKQPQVKFEGDVKHIVRFLYFLADDVRRELAQLGFAYVDQLVGRANILELDHTHKQHKSMSLNLNPLMQSSSGTLGQRNGTPSYAPLPCTALEKAMLEKLFNQKHKKNITYSYCGTINISDRSVGTYLSGEIMRHNDKLNLHKDSNNTFNIKLWGSAGQSLGAFLNKDMTLWVFGDANDHVGKGLSGGTIAISHAPDSPLSQGQHTIIGNVALYGASSGEVYIGGMAGEYFAVCNNGACAVVEGVGNYACQHMLDGTVIVLGPCGENFAQDMFGGKAYVFAPSEHFAKEQQTKTKPLDDDDIRTLRYLLQQHIYFTKSVLAKNLLNDWDNSLEQFIMIKA